MFRLIPTNLLDIGMARAKNKGLLFKSFNQVFQSFQVKILGFFKVECGAKVNTPNGSGSTPLHTASDKGNYKREVRHKEA